MAGIYNPTVYKNNTISVALSIRRFIAKIQCLSIKKPPWHREHQGGLDGSKISD